MDGVPKWSYLPFPFLLGLGDLIIGSGHGGDKHINQHDEHGQLVDDEEDLKMYVFRGRTLRVKGRGILFQGRIGDR